MTADQRSTRSGGFDLIFEDLRRLRDVEFYGLDPDSLVTSIRAQLDQLDQQEMTKVKAWIRRQHSIGFATRLAQKRIERVLETGTEEAER